MNNRAKVTLYGNRTCPYCAAARMLLARKNVEYDDINVGEDPAKFAEMQQRSGTRSVPQIFVGDTLVGGYDKLAALEKDGELDKLLRNQ